MLKIAVFGFYGPEPVRVRQGGPVPHLSPVSTADFMRAVWAMEPESSRVGTPPDDLGFVKLTTVTAQPVYIQSLSDDMAPGAGLLNCDGYIAIIDAVKILAPRAIHNALQRLRALHPTADLIIAAARQNEPDALSSDEIRAILGLHRALPIMPYVPDEPKTVHRLIRRMVRYIDNPDRIPPPIFFGDEVLPPPVLVSDSADALVTGPEATTTPAPRIHWLDHVALPVRDLDHALAFYQGVLGFRLLGFIDLSGEEFPVTVAHLDTGRGLLALVAGQGGAGGEAASGPGGARLAFRVTALDAIAGRLIQEGVSFVRQPANTAYGVRTATITDPDGTVIELIEGDFVYTRR